MFNKLRKYYKKININNTFYFFIIFIIVLKIWMMIIPYHPFDFWSFINRSQRYILYDINIFEQDNKGGIISIIYILTYFVYEISRSLISLIETHNLIFLNLISKLPFLLFEIITGIIIYKTVLYFKLTKDNAKKIFILYFINPINFYIYGIHGHYETLVPFALSLFIYLHITKKYNISAIFLAIAFSIKYIPIIYVPIAIFYIIVNSPKKWVYKSIQFLISFSLSSFILFFNIFFTGDGYKTIQNAINLSSSSGSSIVGETIYTINPLNWISSFTYIFQNEYITNLSNPILFNIANKGIYISLILILIFILRRMLVTIRGKTYTSQDFINDILILTITVFINLSNFQGHYISWIVTLIYLNISFFSYIRSNLYLLFITATFYLYASENGISTTYSLVNLNEKFNFFVDKSFSKITGSIFIVSLIILLVNLIIKNKQINKLDVDKMFKQFSYMLFILWIPLIMVSVVATKEYINLFPNQPRQLTFSKNYNYIDGIYFDIFNLENINISQNKYLFQNKGLINTNIIRISKINPDKYKTLIIIQNMIDEKYNQDLDYKNFKLNECDPKKIIFKNNDNNYIKTQLQENLYIPSDTEIVLLFENKCIAEQDNYLNITNENNLDSIDISKIRLMISNF